MKPRKEPLFGGSARQFFTQTEKPDSNIGYGVEAIFGLEAFLAMQSDWENLNRLDSSASPYVLWNWVRGWLDVWGKGCDFITLVCRQEGRVVAIVPFLWKSKTSFLEVKKLWMLGFQAGVGGNGLTEEPIFVMDSEVNHDDIWRIIHRQLEQMLEHGLWDSIAYRRFGAGIEACSLVEVKSTNIQVQDFHRGCEMVALPDTWEKYLKTISKSMRENIPYYRKKFVKEGLDFQVETVALSEVDNALETLIALHKKRTYLDASMQHNDYFLDDRAQRLFKNAVRKMVTDCEAHVVVLRVQGEIIAAQVFLQNEHTLLAHYSGFDPDWAKYSPLFVLQTEVIREAIGKGFNNLNLLRGNAEWQKRWGAQPAQNIVDVTLARQVPVARVRQVLQHREGQFIQLLGKVKAVKKLRASYELRHLRAV